MNKTPETATPSELDRVAGLVTEGVKQGLENERLQKEGRAKKPMLIQIRLCAAVGTGERQGCGCRECNGFWCGQALVLKRGDAIPKGAVELSDDEFSALISSDEVQTVARHSQGIAEATIIRRELDETLSRKESERKAIDEVISNISAGIGDCDRDLAGKEKKFSEWLGSRDDEWVARALALIGGPPRRRDYIARAKIYDDAVEALRQRRASLGGDLYSDQIDAKIKELGPRPSLGPLGTELQPRERKAEAKTSEDLASFAALESQFKSGAFSRDLFEKVRLEFEKDGATFAAAYVRAVGLLPSVTASAPSVAYRA